MRFAAASLLLFLCVPAQAQIIDHTSVASFNNLETATLAKTMDTKIWGGDRSVGEIIKNTYQSCPSATSYGQMPNVCRRYRDASGNLIAYTQADFDAGRVPAYAMFQPNPTLFNSSNWAWSDYAETSDKLWTAWIHGLEDNSLTLYGANIHPWDYKVLNMAFMSYLNNESYIAAFLTVQGPTQADPTGNYNDIYDLQRVIDEKLVPRGIRHVFWTASIDQQQEPNLTAYNNAMRAYCVARRSANKDCLLYDLADVESHDRLGNQCLNGTMPVICAEQVLDLSGHPATTFGRMPIMKSLFVAWAVALVEAVPPPPPPLPVIVTISPTEVTLITTTTQQFTATVANSTNTAVTWTATCGVILPTGLYTAPISAGSCIVSATSQADPDKSASAVVTVEAPPVPLTLNCNANTSSCSIDGIAPGQAYTVLVTTEDGRSVTVSLTRPSAGVVTPDPNILPLFARADFTLQTPLLPNYMTRQGFDMNIGADLTALRNIPDCKPEDNCQAGMKICQYNTTSACARFYAGMPRMDVYVSRKVGTAAAVDTKIGTMTIDAPSVVLHIIPGEPGE